MMVTITVLMIFLLSDFRVVSSNKPDVNSRKKFRWTPELNAIVKDIFHATKSKGKNHEKSMKEAWDKLLPHFSAVQPVTLRRRALNLSYKGGENWNRPVQWTPELESDLLKMYIQVVNSKKKGVSFQLHDEFYKKHLDTPRLTPHALWQRARLVYEKLKPEGAGELRMRTPWAGEYAEDALRIYREHSSHNEDLARKLHREWSKLHPEHENKDPHVIHYRMRRIAQQAGEKEKHLRRHKFTRENNAELLHIYRQIDRNKFQYTHWLRECWEKMNPELCHLDREQLRKRLKYLLNVHYKPTESEEQNAKIKYDSISPPEPTGIAKKKLQGLKRRKTEEDKNEVAEARSGNLSSSRDADDHRRKPRRMNTEKSRIDRKQMNVLSTSMSPRQQNWHPHKFCDFMSVNESHKGFPRIPDENTPKSYVPNGNPTSHNNPNAVSNFTNSHRGESSNSTSHQHSNTCPESPSRNPLELFFNFL